MNRQATHLLRYAARRLAQAIPLAAAVLVAAFLLIHLAPGDPLLLLAGDSGTPEYYTDMRIRYGLDRPLSEQFVRYVKNILQGECGYSFSYHRPVVSVVAERLPATLLLGGVALVLGILGGLLLGLVSSFRPGSWLDAGVRVWTAAVYALPVFWLGQLLILEFALRLALFPVAGMTSARSAPVRGQSVADLLWHLALPAATLSLSLTALTARVARATLLDALSQPWATAVRSRGVSRVGLLLRHALPNALVPVVMISGHQAGMILSGAALTEVVFAWPGLGRLLLDASLNRDAPLALAIFLCGAVTVVIANLAADVLCLFIDPRIEDA